MNSSNDNVASLPRETSSTLEIDRDEALTENEQEVAVKGNGEKFERLGLSAALVKNIVEIGYTEPTPIQVKAIPAVLEGKDMVGLAQTGTGKTAAFMLPIINQLLQKERKGPRVLVVVPTRELAEQVLDSTRAFAKGLNLRAMSIYGGVPADRQRRELKQPIDIIVGCPGRLLDLLEQRAFSLATIEHLVLDEADQMFDMGFIVPIRHLLRALPKHRQSLLFSATMPEEIATLTREALTNPIKVQVSPVSSPNTVEHFAYPVPAHLKQKLLTHLLSTTSTESVLVFTRTKHKARKLARFLEREGVKATSLQGNLSQAQRMQSMRGFKSGKYAVMVATDIASRGIDISSVSHVVNFDLPDTNEAYLHRTGRTGRALREGDAITFVTPSDENDMRRMERALRIKIERRTKVEGFDYSAKAESMDDFPPRGDEDRPRRFSRGRGESRGRPYADRGEQPSRRVHNGRGTPGAGPGAGSRWRKREWGSEDRPEGRPEARFAQRGAQGERPYAPRDRSESAGHSVDSRRSDSSSSPRSDAPRRWDSRRSSDAPRSHDARRSSDAPRSGESQGSRERTGGQPGRSRPEGRFQRNGRFNRAEGSQGYRPRGEGRGEGRSMNGNSAGGERRERSESFGQRGPRDGAAHGGSQAGRSSYRGGSPRSGGGSYGGQGRSGGSSRPAGQGGPRGRFSGGRSRRTDRPQRTDG